jgi:hypothetical protein
MAFTYTVNQVPATGADAWVVAITALVAGGWTVPTWSDGTTVHNTSQPTAANLKILHSWFRMRSPADPNTGQHREFIVQNGQTGTFDAWGVKYSPIAGFVSTQLLGLAQVANGSTTVTFTVPQTIKTTQAITFASQPTVAYYVTANTADSKTATLTVAYSGTSNNFTTTAASQPLLGTVTVTNGLTSVTFSQNQTIPAGSTLVFSAQPAVTYYLASSITAATAANTTVAYSGTGGSGGTTNSNAPTPVNAPSALDENSWPNTSSITGILGFFSGTTGQFSFIFANDNTYKMHMAVGDSSSNYSWYYTMVTNSTTTQIWGMGMDILTPWAGTSDVDPCICIGVQGSNSWLPSSMSNGGAQAHAGGIEATPLSGFAGVAGHSFQNASVVTPVFRALPLNSWSGSIPIITPIWISSYQGANSFQGVGVRGWSQLMLADLSSPARTNMDLFTITNPGDHIWVNGVLLPWPTGVAVVS